MAEEAQQAHHRDQAQQIGKQLEDTISTMGEALIHDMQGPDALGKLRRYQTSDENSLYRALHELQRLQAARQGSPITPPAAVDIGVSISVAEPAEAAEEKS